jgi:hypothetical protein
MEMPPKSRPLTLEPTPWGYNLPVKWKQNQIKHIHTTMSSTKFSKPFPKICSMFPSHKPTATLGIIILSPKMYGGNVTPNTVLETKGLFGSLAKLFSLLKCWKLFSNITYPKRFLDVAPLLYTFQNKPQNSSQNTKHLIKHF